MCEAKRMLLEKGINKLGLDYFEFGEKDNFTFGYTVKVGATLIKNKLTDGQTKESENSND